MGASGAGHDRLSAVEEAALYTGKKKEAELSVSRCAYLSECGGTGAGYSAENAVSACVRDLERLYGEETDILKEFRYIESQQKVSVPVEELFLDLGDRSGVEDIENFALVFHTAKRTGET